MNKKDVPTLFRYQLNKQFEEINGIYHKKINKSFKEILPEISQMKGSIVYVASGNDLEYMLKFPAENIVGIDNRYLNNTDLEDEVKNKTYGFVNKLHKILDRTYKNEDVLEEHSTIKGYQINLKHPNGYNQKISLINEDVNNRENMNIILEKNSPIKLLIHKGLSGTYDLENYTKFIQKGGYIIETDYKFEQCHKKLKNFKRIKNNIHFPIELWFDTDDTLIANGAIHKKIH